jgi:hypothetical protein
MASHERNNLDQRSPDTTATPEGDGEFAPDGPLVPAAVEADLNGLETPSGSAPAPVQQSEMTVLEKVLDEISHGTLLP